MTKPFSLSKSERLKSKKDIDTLFLTGKAFFVFPFKVCYQLIESSVNQAPLVFGISVPKRNFKRAVDRNSIKRKVREIYRVNKLPLKNELLLNKKTLHLMFLYIHKESMSTKELSPVMCDIVTKLMEKVKANAT